MKTTLALASLAAYASLGAAALATGSLTDAWKVPARYEFEYHVRLADLGPPGKAVRLWIPYPAENRDQKILSSKIDAPWKYRRTQEKKFGNQMIYTEGKADPGLADFVMHLQVERRPSIGEPLDGGAFRGTLNPALYRSPDRLGPISGVIEKIAEEESQGRTTDEEKIQAFYDYVYRTMTYNKDGTGWGRGDAVWACTNKRGNCTDFHSLFIAMLRSQGIAARFLIGFPIPEGEGGTVAGYHCWAEFYDPKHGWVPVDASEAKKKGLKDSYFGSLPNDRIEFTIGRDVVLEPAQKGEPLNYFIYPYSEVDGQATSPPKAEFRFKRLEESPL